MSTTLLKKDINIDFISTYDLTLKQNNSEPQILIYHTHSQEVFVDSNEDDDSRTIVGVGEYLAEILHKQFGYNVIHCTEKFDYVNGKEDRSGAYQRARPVLEALLYKYPTIEVVLDIHRDGVNEDVHLVTTINGKKTAKLMFFNGLCRDSNGDPIEYGSKSLRKENLAMSFRMKLLAEEFYPSLTRRNYVNAYHYNMNLKEKSMLIEVGAQTNTFAEAKNSMEPLAMLLSMILN
jgi:stage II sporulation protein P